MTGEKKTNEQGGTQALFYNNIQAINKNTHANAGLNKIEGRFKFAATTHMVPIVFRELAVAAVSYPIIFIGDDRLPAAALGLAEGKNLFIGDDAMWVKDYYVPTAVRRYPFLMATDKDGKNKFLCVDEDAASFAMDKPDLAFFEGDKPSKMVESAMRECEQFELDMARTNEQIKRLKDFDLYCIKTLSYGDKENDKDNKIQFTAIDENRLKELSAEQLRELRDHGLLDLIYAHFISLANWNRLISRQSLATAN